MQRSRKRKGMYYIVMLVVILAGAILITQLEPQVIKALKPEVKEEQKLGKKKQVKKRQAEQQKSAIRMVELQVIKVAPTATPARSKPAAPIAAAPAANVATGAKTKSTNGSLSIIGNFACDKQFYLRQMRQLGAKIVVYDMVSHKYWNLSQTGGISPLQRLSGFSPVARRLSEDYPGSSNIFKKMREMYGHGNYEILLLWPQEVEVKVRNFLAASAQRAGLSQPLQKAWIQYVNDNGNLVIRVRKMRSEQRLVNSNDALVL